MNLRETRAVSAGSLKSCIVYASHAPSMSMWGVALSARSAVNLCSGTALVNRERGFEAT